MNFDHIKTIHFVGIGGIGMSGIAEVLADAGVSVSGCDLKRSASTYLLSDRGVRVIQLDLEILLLLSIRPHEHHHN